MAAVLSGAIIFFLFFNKASQLLLEEPFRFNARWKEFHGSLEPVIESLMNDSYQILETHLTASHSDMLAGEMWKQVERRPFQNVAIIIPFRDRDEHLYKLLFLLLPLLKKQNLSFRVIVAEQRGSGMFNKGRLLNAAFDYARGNYRVDCVIFHDVDMLPEDDHIPYSCAKWPMHLGAYVNTFNYTLLYSILTGGVLALNSDQMEMVNGYSNEYWGWGGEDDDMGKRLLSKRLKLVRPDPLLARYTMFTHTKRYNQEPMYIRRVLTDTLLRMHSDGLNSKAWTITEVASTALFDRLLIELQRFITLDYIALGTDRHQLAHQASSTETTDNGLAFIPLTEHPEENKVVQKFPCNCNETRWVTVPFQEHLRKTTREMLNSVEFAVMLREELKTLLRHDCAKNALLQVFIEHGQHAQSCDH
uniref:Beta-1,4-N-acetylgalactosaminyltransferase n=1 Tax=Plectus sambesii TaxID=2011161 RepID=A0A914XRV4_9BILA